MKYKELSASMERKGWASHIAVACNTHYHRRSGKKHFTANALGSTATGKAYLGGTLVPDFDCTRSKPATICFDDEHGLHREPVWVDSINKLVLSISGRNQGLKICYLSDIPRHRLVF